MSATLLRAGFFSKQVIGDQLINDYLVGHSMTSTQLYFGNSMGEAVFDSTATGLTLTTTFGTDAINERRLSVAGDLWCLTASGMMVKAGSSGSAISYTEGSRTIYGHNPAWFQDLPYENADGSTYYVYASSVSVPVDVSIGIDTTIGYDRYTDVCGFEVTPDSVSEVSGAIEIVLDGNLTSLGMQRWLTANHEDDDWSYDCVVWLDSSVEIASSDPDVAIAQAKLHKRDPGDGTGWVISLSGIGDGKLGQSTVSTTAAHYKVAILGPIVTNSTALQSNDGYVYVGSIASLVGSETPSYTGQNVVVPFSQYVGAFTVDHDGVTGYHNQLTVANGANFNVNMNHSSQVDFTIINNGSASARLVVAGDIAASSTISGANLSASNRVRSDKYSPSADTNDITIEQTDGTADRAVSFINLGSGFKTIVDAGQIEAVKTNDGTGDFVAHNQFQYDAATTVTEQGVVDAFNAFYGGDASGSGTLALDNGGGEVNNVHVAGSSSGTQTVLVPVSLPDGFVVQETYLRAYRDAAGTPGVSARLCYWEENATAEVDVAGTNVNSGSSGSWQTDSTTSIGYAVSNAVGRQWYVKILITNNGVSIDTARFGRFTIIGRPTKAYSMTV